MKCIYCGTLLSSIDYCTGCGADVTIQKRVSRISNLLYNEGLEKAQVRDLSGAISCLKRSLKFNKENIDARNLLGLCYYETGEVVSALGEWVISKNTVEAGNAADFYISKLQSNKNKLETINTTIKKYNQALLYCKQDDEDMAVIQLKKILSQNPNLIKAYHLLSLIYMKQQDYEKARKLLKKAAHIDTTNTTTLRYLREVEEATGVATNLNKSVLKYRKMTDAEEEGEKKLFGAITYQHGNDTIIQPPTFRDSSSMATFLNIGLGFILGAAIVWFLAIPANTRKINHSASQTVIDANTKLASVSAQITELQDEIGDYQSKIDDADQVMERAQKKADGYEVLLKAVNQFLSGDETTAGNTLVDVDKSSLGDEAVVLYEMIESSVQSSMYLSLYQEGTTAYASGDYKTATEKLEKAVAADDTQYDGWYYLAFSYYNLGESKKADETFAKTIVKFPAFESLLAPYMADESVLTKAKSEGVVTTSGDTTTTSVGAWNNGTGNDQTGQETDASPNTAVDGSDASTIDDTYGYDTTNYDYNYGSDTTGANGYYDAYGNWISY